MNVFVEGYQWFATKSCAAMPPVPNDELSE